MAARDAVAPDRRLATGRCGRESNRRTAAWLVLILTWLAGGMACEMAPRATSSVAEAEAASDHPRAEVEVVVFRAQRTSVTDEATIRWATDLEFVHVVRPLICSRIDDVLIATREFLDERRCVVADARTRQPVSLDFDVEGHQASWHILAARIQTIEDGPRVTITPSAIREDSVACRVEFGEVQVRRPICNFRTTISEMPVVVAVPGELTFRCAVDGVFTREHRVLRIRAGAPMATAESRPMRDEPPDHWEPVEAWIRVRLPGWDGRPNLDDEHMEDSPFEIRSR